MFECDDLTVFVLKVGKTRIISPTVNLVIPRYSPDFFIARLAPVCPPTLVIRHFNAPPPHLNKQLETIPVVHQKKLI